LQSLLLGKAADRPDRKAIIHLLCDFSHSAAVNKQLLKVLNTQRTDLSL